MNTSELERRKAVVAERCKGFEYAGNYTGSNGTADIKCTVCGDVTTRSWVSIRHGNVRCRHCEELEIVRKQQRAEDEKKRKAVQSYFVRQARINSKQLEMRVCLHCGKVFLADGRISYCSTRCAKATNNSIKKDRRLRKLKAANYDSTISLPRVYDRDNGVCYLCGGLCDWNDYEWRGKDFIAGDNYPSVEHVVALHDGGSHTWDNVRLAHRICNSLKH
jgi:hypothetical protein